MGDSETGTLARARDAFEQREWDIAFQGLATSDVERPLAAADLERLGESARWSRHFPEMLDAFERAAEVYERAGDLRSAARVAVKLTLEHYARNGDALAAGWLAHASRHGGRRTALPRAGVGADVHGSRHVFARR